jgi:SAM-dependent methyltransferase
VTVPPQGSAVAAGYPLPSLEMRRTWDALAAGETAVYVGDPASGAEELAGLLGRLGGDPRGGTCIEVGCGPGRMTGALAERFDRVIALDVSPAMLEQARTNVTAANVTFQLVSGERLDGVEDGVADVLVCYLVLQHLPRAAAVRSYLREFARALAPGGEAYVQVPVLEGVVGRARRMLRTPFVHLSRSPERGAAFRGYRLTRGELDRALSAARLDVTAEDEGPSAYRSCRDRFLRLTRR